MEPALLVHGKLSFAQVAARLRRWRLDWFSARVLVVVPLMVASMSACTLNDDSLAGMSCSMEPTPSAENCSASLQLTNATLWFEDALRFRMAAEYGACYQRELMTVNGSYRRIDGGENGPQLVLHATSIEGSNIADLKIAQAVGKVQLNANGSRARYTDLWALQHMPSYAKASAPVASLNCERGS